MNYIKLYLLLSSVSILTTLLHAKEVLEKKQVSNGEVEITVEEKLTNYLYLGVPEWKIPLRVSLI